jgi:hypothetical protein
VRTWLRQGGEANSGLRLCAHVQDPAGGSGGNEEGVDKATTGNVDELVCDYFWDELIPRLVTLVCVAENNHRCVSQRMHLVEVYGAPVERGTWLQ